MWLQLPVLVLVVLALAAAPMEAQKTDVVQLANGDRLTGEIKELQRGQLSLTTDPLGTVSIHWLDVVSVTSDKELEIELTDGTYRYGHMAGSEDGRQVFTDVNGTRHLIELRRIVWLTPMASRFLSRFDGSLDLGLSFLRQNTQFDYTLGGRARYNGYGSELVLEVNSLLRTQSDSTTAERDEGSLRYSRFFAPRTFWTLGGSVESNSQLSLDLRSAVSGGFGRGFLQTNNWNVTLWGGGSLIREKFDGGKSGGLAMGVLSFVGEYFTEANLETDVRIGVDVLPALNQGGRVRLEGTGEVLQEIIVDFFFKFRIFGSYDSKPPTAGTTSKEDWGFTTSLGWKF